MSEIKCQNVCQIKCQNMCNIIADIIDCYDICQINVGKKKYIYVSWWGSLEVKYCIFNHPGLLCFWTEGKHQCWFCFLRFGQGAL